MPQSGAPYLNHYVLHHGEVAMKKFIFIFCISLLAVNIASAENVFNKDIIIKPQKTKTVTIPSDVPLSFNAEFQNMGYKESEICGNCLHIKTIFQGAVNTAASNFGVGFIFVQPIDGNVKIDVYHDYKTSKKIKITATIYKGNFKIE